MTWGKVWWPAYLIIASITFLIPEFIALFTNVKNTLSNYARFELNLTANVTTHTIAWWISLCAWGLFIVVMTLHIWGNQLG